MGPREAWLPGGLSMSRPRRTVSRPGGIGCGVDATVWWRVSRDCRLTRRPVWTMRRASLLLSSVPGHVAGEWASRAATEREEPDGGSPDDRVADDAEASPGPIHGPQADGAGARRRLRLHRGCADETRGEIRGENGESLFRGDTADRHDLDSRVKPLRISAGVSSFEGARPGRTGQEDR